MTIEEQQTDTNLTTEDIGEILNNCAKTNNMELVNHLLTNPSIKNKTDINFQPVNFDGDKGNSPLMSAMFYKNLEFAKYLLNQEEMDVNAREWNDDTAIDCGIGSGFVDNIDFILKHEKGKNLNAYSIKNGLTTLLMYSTNNKKKTQAEIFKLIWNFKTDAITGKFEKVKESLVNRVIYDHSKEYITTLIANSGNEEIAKIVFNDEEICNQINLSNRNGYRYTAADIAKSKGHTKILKMIKDFEKHQITAYMEYENSLTYYELVKQGQIT